MTVHVETNKYKSAFGIDGSQIVHKKKNANVGGRIGENRAPLHLPKQ